MKAKLITSFLIAGILSSWMILVNKEYKINPENSVMTISGTSSLHDWEMKLEKSNVNLSVNTANSILIIEKVNFSGEAKSLKSESSLMDKKAYEALKADKHPQIKFALNTPPPKVEIVNGTFKGIANGNLTIAGVTKSVSFPFSGKLNNNDIVINGSEKIDMTQFGINPPTAMLGSLKTGKDVTVSFSLNLKQQQ